MIPFLSITGSGSPKFLQIADSNFSWETSEPSITISSPTMTAGATGRSSSKYSSVLYSAIGLDMVSISMSYFSPSLGIISLKCFHGLPLGSFIKNIIFSMITSFFLLQPCESRIDPAVENPQGEDHVVHCPDDL